MRLVTMECMKFYITLLSIFGDDNRVRLRILSPDENDGGFSTSKMEG
jgi:hypothetical protein